MSIRHGLPLAKISSPKTHQIKRNRKSTSITTSPRTPPKATKSKAFPQIWRGKITKKRGICPHVWFPHQNPQRKSTETLQRKSQEMAPKIARKGKTGEAQSEGPIRRPERGEWMGADKNSSRRRLKLRQHELAQSDPQNHTLRTSTFRLPKPRSHWSATGPRNKH
jgi:hypothetical protein